MTGTKLICVLGCRHTGSCDEQFVTVPREVGAWRKEQPPMDPQHAGYLSWVLHNLEADIDALIRGSMPRDGKTIAQRLTALGFDPKKGDDSIHDALDRFERNRSIAEEAELKQPLDVKAELDKLTDEQRHNLLIAYCVGCGSKVVCHCTNDE